MITRHRRENNKNSDMTSTTELPYESDVTRNALTASGAHASFDDGSSIGSIEENWGVVSDYGVDDDLAVDNPVLPSGILILSGSEHTDNKHPDETARECIYRTVAELSLPRTDSIPSEIDSLQLSEHAVNSNHFNPTSDVADRVPSNARLTSDEEIVLNSMTKPYPFLLVGLSMVLTAMFAYLAWDRHAWRATAMRLEEELRQWREKQELQSENRSIFLLNNRHTAVLSDAGECDEDIFDLNPLNSHDDDVVLADNCWVRAKASITLGECANDAKTNLKDISTGLFDSFEVLGKFMWDTASSLKQQAGAANLFDGTPLQTAGMTLDALSEASSAFATATVAATDVLSGALRDASAIVDESFLQLLDATRNAIDDATATIRLK